VLIAGDNIYSRHLPLLSGLMFRAKQCSLSGTSHIGGLQILQTNRGEARMKWWKLRRNLRVAKIKLAERGALQRWIARKVLPFTQSMGFSVVGDHFYEPVPNVKQIREN
jgi:hypothetical protein